MKINLAKKIYEVSGRPSRMKYQWIENVDGEEKDMAELKDITVGSSIIDAVLYQANSYNEDPKAPISEEEIKKRYDIYLRAKGQDELELNDEEVIFVKQLICSKYMPLQAGQILEAFE
jgi:hypothetical protein